MRNAPFWWIFLALLLILDWYVFQAIRTVTAGLPVKSRLVWHTLYWSITVLSISLVILLPYFFSKPGPHYARSILFALVAGLFLAKLIASLFFLTDDLRRVVQWLGYQVLQKNKNAGSSEVLFSRSVFLSWAGLLAGAGLFSALSYGINNRYRYQLRKLRLTFPTLPAAFDGLKIVQLSDIHAGSFTDPLAVEKGIQLILDQAPDLILFTGDLVNNLASEMDEYWPLFAKLKAPMGVYSITGNHDYADYVQWESPAQKIANFEKLKAVHAKMGWQLLMNEHVVVTRNQSSIGIIGIENWSAKSRFPKYGNFKKAFAGAEQIPFSILLSHDPSHWRAEILEQYPSVALTLSGHTHGMQFGFEIPGLQWSPVQYVYSEWAGVYRQATQTLYVNRGFGFIGYPGRVGILPEITVIELFSKD
ncbi:MAG: metallophosphoesterase [Bacteroidetes bacterium]|nr:metallophosphoesterase [Bacteroidota bacterium]